MASMKLYDENGWLNTDVIFADPAPFIIMVGGRGIGKTFGVLREVLRRDLRFIYLRRTQAQIDLCKLPELNPFKSVNDAYGFDIVADPIGKYMAGFYHTGENGKPAGDPVGIGIALSTFANVRGVDGSDYDIMVYDEFIPERHERAIKEEGAAFLNALETINRNRELQGRDPVKTLLLSNSNSLDSPILLALGALRSMDDMTRKGKVHRVIHSGLLSIYRYTDSPISARKRQTALYQVASDSDFTGMALDNSFSAANFEQVRPLPLDSYQVLVSIDGITVYKHKSQPTYYIIEGIRGTTVYDSQPLAKRAFQIKYWYLKEAMLELRVYYSSATAKIIFERLW